MVYYFSEGSSKCLFCKKGCDITKLKNVIECGSKDEVEECSCYSFPARFVGSSLEKCDSTKVLTENLRYAFILRELLDFPKRRCMKYMKQQLQYVTEEATDENRKDVQDGWFSVCETCTKLVEEGHGIYHEIEQLKSKLDVLKNNLRELLTSSQEEEQAHLNDEDIGSDAGVNTVSGRVEKSTIFSEVQNYFVPESLLSKEDGTGAVVKMEIEASPPFGDEENPLIDDLLANDNFDDGSDWAPSEADEVNEEDGEAEEPLDVKPNIDSDPPHSQVAETEENEKPEEANQEEQAEKNDVTHSIHRISSQVIKDKFSKPGPLSRKLARMRRSTRYSKRFKRGDQSDDTFRGDAEEMEAMDTVQIDSKGEATKTGSKIKKSIISDTESESTTETEESDDSNADDKDKNKFKFACATCDATFHTKHRLRDHEALHSRDDAKKCEQCPFVAVSSRGLNMHIAKIHRKNRQSDEKKNEPRKLSTPSPSKEEQKPKSRKLKARKDGEYSCSYCPVVFQTAHRLKEHEDHHSNPTTDMMKCQQCNYVCLSERGMKIHVTRYHTSVRREDKRNDSDKQNPQEKPTVEYRCNICGIEYKSRHRLKEHNELHQNENANKCSASDCPFVCKTKKTLRIHMHYQHGIKPPRRDSRRRKAKARGKPREYSGNPQHCQLCPAKYYTNYRFQQHIKLHSSETNYPCEECGWVFSSSDKRDYHMKLSHERDDIIIKAEPKTFRCSHCDEAPFDARYKFKEHLLLHHQDKIFQCKTCDQVYECMQLYDLHIEKCTKNDESSDDNYEDNSDDSPDSKKLFPCTQCKAKFSLQKRLNRHIALKHSTEQFPCTLCTIVFPTESRLRYHMARQHDKVQNVCKICGYKAHGASHLRLHMQKHTKERLFACELCGKTFVSPTYLTAHRQMEHLQELGLQPIQCDQCDLQFPNKSILKYHIQKIHEKKFKYFCESCGKGFLFASGLKNHSAIHSDQRDQICQYCGAAYVHNRVLMDHLKKHHPQEYAAAKGIDPSTIKVPQGVTTDGPFSCKFCSLEFPSKWGLHSHLKSHTEVYDKYKCGICGKGYSSPAGVKRHEETAHVEATFSCNNCGKGFPCKDYLRYHIKNHCRKRKSDDPSEMEPIPSSSKHIKIQDRDIKHDPHIVKEAGLLHIVTPNTAAAFSSSTNASHHHTHTAFTQEPGSGASSSSSTYVGHNPHQEHQHQEPLTDEAAVNSFYRNYFSHHGFSNK